MSTRIKTASLIIASGLVLVGCTAEAPSEPIVEDVIIEQSQTTEESQPAEELAEPEAVVEQEATEDSQTEEPQEATEKPQEAVDTETKATVDTGGSTSSTPSLADIAYSQIIKFADGSATVSPDVLVASSNLPDFHVQSILTVTADSMSMFDERYDLPTDYNVIAFTDLDFEWADQKLVEYGGQLPGGSWQTAWDSSNQMPNRCWLAINSNGNTHFCMALSEKVAKQQINTLAHEYFHNVQMGPIGLDPTRTPIWITEGGAEYMGWAITQRGSDYTLDTLADWNTMHLVTKYGVSGFRNYVFAMTEADFVSAMQAMEAHSMDPTAGEAGRNYAMYKLGAAANEYLIGKYSYDVYMDYLETIGKGNQEWSSAFATSFGTTPVEFYLEFYNYLRESFK